MNKIMKKYAFFALFVALLPLGLGAMEQGEATQVAEAYHNDGGYGPVDSKVELGDVDDQVTSQDYEALRKYEIAVAEKLIAIVGDENLTNEEKKKALDLSLKGADVNAKNKDGMTPLQRACFCNNFDMVKYLVERGADVNAVITGVACKGATPLHQACSYNNFDIVKYLVEQGADVNAAITGGVCKGETPLQRACFCNNFDMVKYLVEQDADVNAKNKDGETPLYWACIGNNFDIVKYLVEQGADVNAKDEDGKMPRDKATDPKVKSYLEMAKDFYAVNAKTMTFEAFANKHLINANVVEYETAKGLMAEIAQTGGLSLQKSADLQKDLECVEQKFESRHKLKLFADYARRYTNSGDGAVRMDNIADIHVLLHLGTKHFFDAFTSFVEKHELLTFSGGECGEMGPERHWMFFDCATRRGPQQDLWLKECFALIGKEYPFEKTSAFEEAVTKYLSKLPAKEQERLTKEKNESVQKRNMFLAIPKKPGQTGFAAKNLVKDLKITFKK